MKTYALIALSSLLLGSAFAGQAKAPAAPKTIKCPVEGGSVNIADATKHHMYADYKGNRYFFCCGGCPETFKKNPEKFAKAPHVKTPTTK